MNYEKKYLKYKSKYLDAKEQLGGFIPSYETLIVNGKLAEVKSQANRAGYILLKELDDIATLSNWKKVHKIATAESLTAGLIFSTLVDIPAAGWAKYGAFAVYDSDAKRIFLGVEVDDVYTHKCAAEMAIGVLRNSNATLAIAVTGNAMATPAHKERIGEVFIGVAGYNNQNQIIVQTSVHNFCNDIVNTCGVWLHDNKYKSLLNAEYTEEIVDPNNPSKKIKHLSKQGTDLGLNIRDIYAPLQITEIVASYIRNRTVLQAYNEMFDFIKKHNPIVPDFIDRDRIETTWQEGLKPNASTILQQLNQSHNILLQEKDRQKYQPVCVSSDNKCYMGARTPDTIKEFYYDLM